VLQDVSDEPIQIVVVATAAKRASLTVRELREVAVGQPALRRHPRVVDQNRNHDALSI
jgi:hypothetical protein